MNAALSCDLLVIGLGPAGGAAAAAAAERGLKVLAVDKKREIGLPVQCAEFIPLLMGKYATSEGVLQQRITAMTSHLPSGAVVKTEFPGLMVDRTAFDQALAMRASEAGARLLTGSRLTALDAPASRAELRTPAGQMTVGYRMLIAADGPHSPVAKALGWPALETVDARQYTVMLKAPSEHTDIWLSDAYPGGYAWLFPRGPIANLGLGMDQRFAGDFRKPLDDLHRELLRQGRVGAEVLRRTGGAIPVGGLRDRLITGNILFAGDAAGLTHPITGAGIAAAVVSGERAGEAAAAFLGGEGERALAAFEEDLREQFEQSLARAVARRRWLERHWNTAPARQDAVHRRGWIAFPEYFSNETSLIAEDAAETGGNLKHQDTPACGREPARHPPLPQAGEEPARHSPFSGEGLGERVNAGQR